MRATVVRALTALKSGRRTSTRALTAVAIVLAALGVVSSAFGASGQDGAGVQTGSTAEVKRGVVATTISADGTVEPPRDLSLGFESGGEVEEVLVEEGEPVRRGQVLARLDQGPARARRRSAERALDSARERLRDTRAGRTAEELDRNRRTLDQAGVAVDSAETELGNAVSAGRTNVAGLRRAVRRATLTGETAQLRASRIRLDNERDALRADRETFNRLGAQLDRHRDALDALRDLQRERLNSGTEAESRRTVTDNELNGKRSNESNAASQSRQARQGESEACGEDPSSDSCSAARRERVEADEEEREAEREVRESEGDLDDARRDELESDQGVNDSDFQIQSLLTRIAAAERDESNAKADLDSSESTVRQYVTDVESDQTTLRESRRSLGDRKDSLANGVEQAQQQIDQARSSLASSVASLEVTRASNRVDEQGADAADLAADRAGVASAATSVEDARKALDDTMIVAPTDGVASAVDAEEGEVVGGSGATPGGGGAAGATVSGSESSDAPSSSAAPAEPSGAGAGTPSGGLITLTELSRLEVKAGFSETDAARLRAGSASAVEVDALPGRRLPARVASVDPVETVMSGVVTYEVTFVLDSYPLELRPGMSASADVVVEESRDALWVPKPAIRAPAGSAPTANVLRADGRLEPRLLITGLEGDAGVEILGGLGEGERVVVSPGASG